MLVSLSRSHNFHFLLHLQLDQVLLEDVVHDGQLARVLRGRLGFRVSKNEVVEDCTENLNIVLL